MKALSIRQPWAWLIANGHKDIENRTWLTNFRGEFLIHASKKPDNMWKDIEEQLVYPSDEILCGGIIGIAEIIDCVTSSSSHWHEGYPTYYGFVIRNARPLPFFPCKGQLGFFEVEYPISLEVSNAVTV